MSKLLRACERLAEKLVSSLGGNSSNPPRKNLEVVLNLSNLSSIKLKKWLKGCGYDTPKDFSNETGAHLTGLWPGYDAFENVIPVGELVSSRKAVNFINDGDHFVKTIEVWRDKKGNLFYVPEYL